MLMKLWDQVLTPDLTLRYFFYNVLRVYNTRILSPYLPGRHFALLITKTRSGNLTIWSSRNANFCYSVVSLVTTRKENILYSLSYSYSIITPLKIRKDILNLSLSYFVKSPVNTRRKQRFTCVVFSSFRYVAVANTADDNSNISSFRHSLKSKPPKKRRFKRIFMQLQDINKWEYDSKRDCSFHCVLGEKRLRRVFNGS